jgi:hypothetical protein
VRRWRLDRFLDLQFAGWEAEMLADGEIDWHDAERLLTLGCPLEVAFELLV